MKIASVARSTRVRRRSSLVRRSVSTRVASASLRRSAPRAVNAPKRPSKIAAPCGHARQLRGLLALALALGALGSPTRACADDDASRIARARALDQQGVRAYREERYKDAIRYFEEALRLGGPPSERWNIAKCHVRLDE